MPISNYINQVNEAYKKGNATEHTYRPALKQLVEILSPHISATNEPKRVECGAPDYIITKKDIPIGYIEAKDVGRLEYFASLLYGLFAMIFTRSRRSSAAFGFEIL